MSYMSEVLADSPQGYWRCGDSSGTLTDVLGTNNLDTIVGSITYSVPGLLTSTADTAISVSGAGRASKAGYTASATEPFTLEQWVKPSAVGGGTYRYWMGNQNDGAASGWRCGTNGAGNWHVSYRSIFDYDFATGPTVNVGYYVVYVCKADDDVDLYVNGAFLETASGATPPGGSILDFTIGSSNGGALPYSGVIDEVAFYTTALSNVRIAAHYAAGIASMEGNLAPVIYGRGAC